MRIDRSGIPFVAGAWVPAVALAAATRLIWAMPLAALGGFFLYFFRDPDRHPPADERAVLAPADGRVLVAGEPEEQAAPPGQWRQVSIFLSPLDVHVNRSPIGGRIVRVAYQAGRFLPAYRREAAVANERNEIWIDRGGQTIVFRQVVGILARRIVCRVAQGETVAAGQRVGIMKFGSRVDVFLPPASRLRVAVGDRVRAAESILAHLPE